MIPNTMMNMMQGGGMHAWPASCDGCRNSIRGNRYKCLTKHNFDLCQMCFLNRVALKMSEHNWSVMINPSIPAQTITERIEKYQWPASCDGCRNSIKGLRYKCLTENNFDFCEDCFGNRQGKGMNGHNWTKMTNPKVPNETINEQVQKVQEVSKPVNNHRWPASCDGCRNTIIGERYKCTTRNNFDFCSNCFNEREAKGMGSHDWNLMTNPSVPNIPIYEKSSPPKKEEEKLNRHRWGASCDGCRNTIIGVRFKCITKNNFDFCENCYPERDQKNMSNHNWTKMIDPNTEFETLNDRIVKEEAPKHTWPASCDGCRNTIIGVRFKCLTRNNYDFCENCWDSRDSRGMSKNNWEKMISPNLQNEIINEQPVVQQQQQQNPMLAMMQQNPMMAQMLQQQQQQNPMMAAMLQKGGQNPLLMMGGQNLQQTQEQSKPTNVQSGEAKDYIKTIDNLINFAVGIEKEKSYGGECRQGWNFHLPKIGFPGEFLDMKNGMEYLRAAEVCQKLLEFMDIKEKELGGEFYPSSEQAKEKINLLSRDCVSKHAKTSIKGFLSSLWDENKKEAYYQQLDRFPGAREYIKKRLVSMKYSSYENRMHELPKDKRFKINEEKFKPSNLQSFNDKVEDYEENFEMIRPADPNLPIRPGKIVEDSQNRMVWTDFRKRHAGKIIFSAFGIDPNESEDGKLGNRFIYGKDEIHGRAVWAHAIRHLAVARDKGTGELIYPALQFKNKSHFNRADFYAEFCFILYVDGKKVVVKGSPFGEIMTMDQRGDQSSGTNFYRHTQSCRLYISLTDGSQTKWNIFDDYQSRAQKFNSVFSGLSKGIHNIRIEMCYRLKVLEESLDADTPLFPPQDTLLSHPIAVGEFQLEIPQNNMSLPNPFPPSTCTEPNGAEIVKKVEHILRESREWGKRNNKTEELIYCIAEGGLYPLYGEYWDRVRQCKVRFVKQYGLEIRAAFYRNPQNGWDHEHVRIFKLAAYNPETDKVDCSRNFSVILNRLGVGGSEDVECDYVPKEIWERNPNIRRCTREMADYYIDLKPEDIRMMGRDF